MTRTPDINSLATALTYSLGYLDALAGNAPTAEARTSAAEASHEIGEYIREHAYRAAREQGRADAADD